jgi:tripeptidyl-peptidase I
MLFALCLLASIVSTVFAAPAHSTHVVHERRAAEPDSSWTLTRHVESDRTLPLRIGLAQSNLHELEGLLTAVSDPASLTYGQHWSPEAVANHFAPSQESHDRVVAWLRGSGIEPQRLKLSPSRGWISVNATIGEVEDLLKTEYHVWTHSSGVEQFGPSRAGLSSLRCLTDVRGLGCHSYSVPDHLTEHIDMIKPTVHFNHRAPDHVASRKRSGGLGKPGIGTGPKTNGQKVKITPSLENCDEMITPDCLRALYDVHYKPVETKKNTYGIGKPCTSA